MGTIQKTTFKIKNDKEIVIRSAKLKDASEIIQLFRKIIKEGLYTLNETDEYKATVSSVRKQIRFYNNSPRKLYAVADINKKIAGFMTADNYGFRRSSHNAMLSIYIAKKFRHLGAGRVMMKELINWGKQNPGLKKLSLAVFSTNKNAIALYKKMGFKKEGTCPGDMIINGKYVSSVLMYKFV